MPEFTKAMQFVLLRAQAEAKAAHQEDATVEFLFLGLLKLAEVQAKDFVSSSSSDSLKAVDDEIKSIRTAFEKHGIDTSRTRGLLRYAVRQNTLSSADALAKCLGKAAQFAAERKSEAISAHDLLLAILENPTDMILQICPIKKKEEKPAAPKEEAATGEKTDEMSLAFLPALTGRIRHMRAQLLSTVQGQDHVVHAFAEGIFAAEVLAASDEKRKRPRAIFVFAGPPGVGKTFLAEQAAEALEIP